MNIYLQGANETSFYFFGYYRGRLLEKIWDFSQPAKR
jgi:hypothetical protein